MTRAYATSLIPIAMMGIIWGVWGLRHLCIGNDQFEKQTHLISQHTEVSLLLSYLVSPFLMVLTKTGTNPGSVPVRVQISGQALWF